MEAEGGVKVDNVKCDVCGKTLDSWIGNIMVPHSELDGDVIYDLQIWCKPCTKELDSKGVGRRYHNLWELSWLKDGGEELLNASSYAKKFTYQAKEKIEKIINAR